MKTRLNHVAMTVSAGELDDTPRAAIVAFYRDVFGWTEQPTTEPGNPLVLGLGEPTQFLFVQSNVGNGTRAAPLDHFGVQVDSEDDLDEILTRARRRAEHDPLVEVIDKSVTRTAGAGDVDYETVNCYVRYRLPLVVEVQHIRAVPRG